MRRTLLVAVLMSTAFAQVKQFKPSRLNFFSKDQDIQMGKEAADEVRKTEPIVQNKDLVDYINRIGKRLAASKHAGDFPFTFEVINTPEINAFALPGGPMFVNTGLIAAVDNESELAGVLAHEMSHVALRHGTTNVSKANLIQLPAMLLQQATANKGGIWGTLGQLGVGLGAQSILLKYSRDAEKEADLNGAQIMNDAGYDPMQMAIFFDKLEEQGNKDNSALANFLSDHPTPGKRVDYVSAEAKQLPKVQYHESEPGELAKMKQIVASLPPPPKQPAQGAQSSAAGAGADRSGQGPNGSNPNRRRNGQGPNGQSPNGQAPNGQIANGQDSFDDPKPSGTYQTHSGQNFQISYPDNWQVFGDKNSGSLTIAPQSGLVQNRQGGTDIAYGMVTAYYFPQNKKVNLQQDTNDLVRQMIAGNPGMEQTGKAKSVKVGGTTGLLTPLASTSPIRNQKEDDLLLTVVHQDAIFYMMFVAPDSDWKAMQPTFDHAVSSLRFTQ